MTRTAQLFYVFLFLCSILYSFYIPVHPDTAYYWNWSRHLAWSYYDGPPFLAYFIRFVRLLFGAHPFSLKCIGVISVGVSAAIVYCLAKRMFDATIALRAMLVFWFFPVVQSVNIVTSLDAPLLVFWSLSLYCAWRWLESERLSWLYCTGFCIGLGLLSKYPMVLMLPALFLFLCFRQRQRLFNPHVYLNVLLAFVIFSPVIYWNAEHHWASFLFQLHHGHGHGAGHFAIRWDTFALFWLEQLGVMNPVFALLLFVGLWRFRQHNSLAVSFLFWPFAFVIGFFAYNALYRSSGMNWVLPAYVSGSILLSYYVSLMQRQWLWLCGVFLSVLIISLTLFPTLTTWMPSQWQVVGRFFGFKPILQQLSQYDFGVHPVLLSDNYSSASEAAFYLPHQPEVYVVTPARPSAYSQWSKPILQRIQAGTVPEVYYFGSADESAWFERHYRHCMTNKVIRYDRPWVRRQWLFTHCDQPIVK